RAGTGSGAPTGQPRTPPPRRLRSHPARTRWRPTIRVCWPNALPGGTARSGPATALPEWSCLLPSQCCADDVSSVLDGGRDTLLLKGGRHHVAHADGSARTTEVEDGRGQASDAGCRVLLVRAEASLPHHLELVQQL